MKTELKDVYEITSVKHSEQVTGSIDDVIARAKQIDAEYQPAFGVQVTDSDGNTVFDTESK